MKRWKISSPVPSKDGETFWQGVGTMFEGKNGKFSGLLNAIPVPQYNERRERNEIFLHFEPQEEKEKEQQTSSTRSRRGSHFQDEDLPF